MQDNIYTEEITEDNKILFGTIKSRIRLLTVSFVTILLIYSIIIFIQSYRTNDDLKKSGVISLNIKNFTDKLLTSINQSAASQRAYFLTVSPSYREANLLLWKNAIFPSLDTLMIIAVQSKQPEVIKSSQVITDLCKKYNKAQEQMSFHIENNINNYLKLVDTAFYERQEKVIIAKNYIKKGTEIIKKELEPLRQLISDKVLVLSKQQNIILQKTLDNAQQNLVTNIYITLTVSLLIILLTISLGYYITSHLRKSVGKSVNLLTQLSRGELPKKASLSYDEFDEIINSINRLSANMRNASEFALQVGRSNFYTIFKSVGNSDTLGNSLLQMREQLRMVAEQEKRRNWVTEGISQFSEIIRNNSDNLEILSESFLLALIDYVGAVQGGVFLKEVNNQEDTKNTKLNLIAHYAYNQKKYTQKTIIIHGKYADTLVGQAYLEKSKILLKEVPDNYLVVSSGLGEEKPSVLLLMPIKINKEVEGILEISFFDDIDEYKMDFIDRVSQVLASSLVSVRSVETTERLLKEFQYQTQQLREQEDVMRQNMEELSSTQEIMETKQKELETLKQSLEIEVEKRTVALKDSLMRFDLINRASIDGIWDMVVPKDGKVTFETPFYWTEQLINSLGYSQDEFPNKLSSWALKVHPEDVEAVFREFIAHFKDKTDKTIFDSIHRIQNKEGKFRWFRGGAKTLRDKDGNGIRIAGFLNDITPQKELDQALIDLKSQQEAMLIKQQELEKANKKMKANEDILKKSLEKIKANEVENKQQKQVLQEQTEMLKAQEEELRQNMEELVATQEEMQKKQIETEKLNTKLQANEEILKKTFEKMKANEAENKQQKQNLQEQTEMLKAQKEEMQQNMEQLMITQNEIQKNEVALKKTIEELKQNNSALQNKLLNNQ